MKVLSFETRRSKFFGQPETGHAADVVSANKRSHRSRTGGPLIQHLLQDLRFTVRSLRKSPGFTVSAVVTLALAIGMNTAVFSVVNAVLLRPVDAPDPDRIVVFMNTNKQGSGPVAAEIEFNLWREQRNVLHDVSAFRTGSPFLTGTEQPEKTKALYVTGDYFHLLNLPIIQGRAFDADEELPNGPHVVILSNAFWHTGFGGDPRVLGKSVTLGGDSCQIIGVMGPDVHTETPEPPDVWLPFVIDPNSSNQVHSFEAVGRLNDGVTLKMANAQLELMTAQFRREYPNTVSARRGDVYSVQRLREILVRDIRLSLLVLVAAVSLVLLVACSNVASLLLVRAASRSREIAIRMAVGASRSRIVRQLLTESTVLSLFAAFWGLVLGMLGVHLLLGLVPSTIPRIGAGGANVRADWRVFLFTVVIAMITGFLFGLAPAVQTSRVDVNSDLKEGGWHGTSGVHRHRVLSALVVGEISLALVLVIASALFIRTLVAVRSVYPGFDGHNVVTTQTPIDPTIAAASGQSLAVRNAVQRLIATPGIETAAFTSLLPLSGDFNSLPVIVVGRPLSGPSHGFGRLTVVSADYFDVLRIPLLRGRVFTDADDVGTPDVAIINEEMARVLWPGGDPLTDRILVAKGLGARFEQPPRQIIGIVGNMHDNGLSVPPQPTVFVPSSQISAANWAPLPVNWVIRMRAPSPSLDASIRNELQPIAGALPVAPLRSMGNLVVRATSAQSFNMLLMTIFGVSALLLAAIGLYGLMSYSARQRTHELGIRIALGAHPSRVRNMVILEGMSLVFIGIAIGMAAALGLTRFIASVLFGVSARDLAVFVTIPVLLSAVALFSVWIPAKRASSIDPVEALRYE